MVDALNRFLSFKKIEKRINKYGRCLTQFLGGGSSLLRRVIFLGKSGFFVCYILILFSRTSGNSQQLETECLKGYSISIIKKKTKIEKKMFFSPGQGQISYS